MKKTMLTLGLTLSLMAPMSFAGMGTETSGGGDAVYINNQMVIRDLLSHDQLTMMVSIDFLNDVPEFKTLIGKISKANSAFAYKVIEDLMKARIYMSPRSIPVLPYEQTTIAGKSADVQLALRDKDDIIFAPEFQDSTQKEYILIHEALHGILKDNTGAMHHQRVRNIVKYIYDNQDKLNSVDFTEFLVKNNYSESAPIKSGYENSKNRYYSESDYNYFIKLSMDSEAEDGLRCYFSNALPSMLRKFQALNCVDDLKFDFDAFYERKLPEVVKLIKELNASHLNFSYYNAPTFTLTKDTILNIKKKKAQQESCKTNLVYLTNSLVVKSNFEKQVSIYKLGKELLKSREFSYGERDVLLRYVLNASNDEKLDKNISEMADQVTNVSYTVNLVTKQHKACQAQYPELF